jgi:hypothetical protein
VTYIAVARRYMHYPVLGARFVEICEAIVKRLEGGSDLVTPVDGRSDVRTWCLA